MLVNQIQRDMNSSNQLETCAALTAVCKIVTADMVPAVIGEVCPPPLPCGLILFR
jgi:AP-4 complex subunit epsilon-1